MTCGNRFNGDRAVVTGGASVRLRDPDPDDAVARATVATGDRA